MKRFFAVSAVLPLVICVAAAQPPIASTTTTLAIAANGSTVTTVPQNSVVTLTATVTASGTPVVPGQVNFCDATAKLCSDIHLIGTAQLTSSGSAVIKFVPGPGTHSYKAVFLGTPNATTAYAGSASAASSLTVTAGSAAASTTTITSSGSPGSYTLTATVTGNASVAPTGTVSFVDTTNSDYVLATAPLTPQPATGTLTFLNSANPGTDPYPQSVAVADFNGDGKLDLAVPAYSLPGLDVFLGNGDGTFQAAPPLSALSPNVGFATVADFNGDGKPDLAITLPDNNSIVVLLGNGDGTFTALPEISVPNVYAIAAADLNGDGIPDLVTANPGSSSLSVLLGKGDGTFAPAISLPVTGQPTWVAVGDFNGDGIPDLAATIFGGVNFPGSIEIFLGNGDGTFTPLTSEPVVGYDPTCVTAGDFKGNGILDLAVSNLASDTNNPATVTVLIGTGNGTFTPTTQTLLTGNLPYSVAIGDFNGDGIPDLVTANAGSNTATVFLGNGDGTFSTGPNPPLGTNPIFAAVGDFNGDGLSDIAGADNGPDFEAPILLAQDTETQTATATVSGISVVGTGTHLVDASYPGDGNYQPSTSATIPLTAEPAPTTLALIASPTAPTFDQPVVFTATLSPYQAQNHVATGSVTFYVGNTVLGTSALTGGVATLTTQALPVGVDTVTAVYPGDPNFASATSASFQVTVTFSAPAATTTTVSASPNPAQFATAVTLTATVTSEGGSPTGTVSFYDGGTLLGTGTLTAGTVTISTSTMTTSTLSVGTHSITASYGGSTNFTQSASSAITVTITPPGFSLTALPPTQTAAAGDSATYTITVVPQTGFTQSVALACAGLQPGTTCSFSPQTVTGGSGSSNLTVQTTATQAKNTSGPATRNGLIAVAGLLLLMVPIGARRRGRQWFATVWLIASLAAGAVLLTGCDPSLLRVYQTSTSTQTILITGTTTSGSQPITATASINLVVETNY